MFTMSQSGKKAADGPITSGAGPSPSTCDQDGSGSGISPPSLLPTNIVLQLKDSLAEATSWNSIPSRHRSLPYSLFKSKSVAELSPTTAHSKSLYTPRRKEKPGLFSSLIGSLSLSSTIRRVKKKKGEEREHIGIVLSKPVKFPLDDETLGSLGDIEYRVRDILSKNEWAVEGADKEQKDTEGQDELARSERTSSPETVISTSSTSSRSRRSRFKTYISPKVRKSPSYRKPSTLDSEPIDPVEEDKDRETVSGKRIQSDDSDKSSSSSAWSDPSTPSRAHTTPRIRRGEDIREYSRRIFSNQHQGITAISTTQDISDIPTTDGAAEAPISTAKMNNFANFDTGNLNPNLARQAPAQPQAQQMNGLNGVTQWPNVGAQSDMNVLWEYIIKLSEMHEQIRSQTQQVASGMQQIESMRSSNGGASTTAAPHLNGIPNGAQIIPIPAQSLAPVTYNDS
jgi:hypothetical protein